MRGQILTLSGEHGKQLIQMHISSIRVTKIKQNLKIQLARTVRKIIQSVEMLGVQTFFFMLFKNRGKMYLPLTVYCGYMQHDGLNIQRLSIFLSGNSQDVWLSNSISKIYRNATERIVEAAINNIVRGWLCLWSMELLISGLWVWVPCWV